MGQIDLTRNQKKKVRQFLLNDLKSKIDFFTSKKGLTHRNVRAFRNCHIHTYQKLENNVTKNYYINRYNVVITINGVKYIGSIEYGHGYSITRKQARQIALKRALSNALNKNSASEEEVNTLFNKTVVTGAC